MLWLGKISFSLYLIHFPLFRLWGLAWVHEFGDKPANLFVCLLASLAAVLIAGVFYKYVEKPSHQLARQVGMVPATI
jgi:peptidoglycan/LPS O-acetylase OafA/YrhL